MKLGAYSDMRGHKTRFDEDADRFVYADDLSPIDIDRPCAKCGMAPTKDGHDDCIANLPGVIYACCGHGDINQAYITLRNKTIIRGEDAAKWMRENKPLPHWHHAGMTGIAVWFSDVYKDVIKSRVNRVMKANNNKGLTMRYCTRCEGPIGIMEQQLYELLYINTGKRCYMCGNKSYDVEGLEEE